MKGNTAVKLRLFFIFITINLMVYMYYGNKISSHVFDTATQIRHIDSNISDVTMTNTPLMTITNSSASNPRVILHVNRACRVAPWEKTNGVYDLILDAGIYFNTNLKCFIEGTMNNTLSSCICKPNWHGGHCSIPDSVWYSDLFKANTFNTSIITPRFHTYKRIIQALPFNMEFDMLDARFAESGDIVDVFLILESNYTAYGKRKPLYLLDSLKQGYYNQTSCRIVHIYLDYFPEKARKNGWLADALHRNHISMQGLVKQLKGYKHSDIFLLTDADEIPSKESLLFLKFHDGYPEPVGISYQTSTYGFFWQAPKTNDLPCAVSVGILFHVLRLQAYSIRAGLRDIVKTGSGLHQYLISERNQTTIKMWHIGKNAGTGGWHCSWCFSPSGIRNKLVSAQNGDFPRWGDYPEKTKLLYIQELIKNGSWFNNQVHFKPRKNLTTHYVPQYFLDNPDIYGYLLVNPYT